MIWSSKSQYWTYTLEETMTEIDACTSLFIAVLFKIASTWVEKEMVIHSSILAWRIPGTKEPGRLPSMGMHRAGHD